MKKINKLSIFIYIALFSYVILAVLNGFRIVKLDSNIKIIFLVIQCLIIKIFSRKEYLRNNDKKENVKEVVFNLGIALLVYFLTGIIFGYAHNVYGYELKSIVNNFFNLSLIYLFIEYIRFYLCLHTSGKKVLYIIITLMFILIDINYFSLINSTSSNKEFFIYLFSTLMPIIVKNIIVMLIFIKLGFYSSTSYQVMYSLFGIYMPLLPNLTYYLKFIALILIPLFVYNKTCIKEVNIPSKGNKKEMISNVIFVIVFIFILCFIFGLFKFVPISVASNSMKPYFKRGDMVIYEKLSDDRKENLKIGDVIVFNYKGDTYIHRIVKSSKARGYYYFTTKGDNNTFNDNGKIRTNDIIGKKVLKVPYIGYPSLWFKSLLDN